MSGVKLPPTLQKQIADSERAKEKIRRENPELYARYYGHTDRATNVMSLNDDIEGQYRRILGREYDPVEDRKQEVERIYDAFTKQMDKPTVLTESDFLRYAPLYSKENRRKIMENTISIDDMNELSELSVEFYLSVNLNKPLYVVADDDHSKIVAELPPVLLDINNTSQRSLNRAVHDFDTVTQLDDGVPGGMAKHNIRKATKNVLSALITNQDWSNLRDQIKNSRRLREEFKIRQKALAEGKDPQAELDKFKAALEQAGGKVLTAEEVAKTRPKNSNDADDVCDFEPMDDDE